MSELASADQAELATEIRKLNAYLEGVPQALRERGLFAAYETRLQDLEEQLMTLRLSSILPRESSDPDGSPASLIRDPDSLSAWVGHLVEVEREHMREAHRLTRRQHLIQCAVVALSVVVGLVVAGNEPFSLYRYTAALAGAVALLELTVFFTRAPDRIRKEHELALRADMLRWELETLQRHARGADGTTPDDNTALDGWTRRKILHLLDEGAPLHARS